jgi:hypothetical protein
MMYEFCVADEDLPEEMCGEEETVDVRGFASCVPAGEDLGKGRS